MVTRGKILAIDDEINIRRFLAEELEQEGFRVITAETGEQGISMLDKENFDLVLVDLKLPDISGIDVIRRVNQMPFPVNTIVISGHGNIDVAVQSMKLGALDFITKPFKLNELIKLIDQAVKPKKIPDLPSYSLPNHQPGDESMIKCPSPAMQELYQKLRRVAATDATVLLQGETGVGKDCLAQEIHFQSKRKLKPYVVVDCGLLSGNLVESELYGHRKGGFSGAYENKMGLVEASDGGTLFLDEIGNIDSGIQKKLLRFLETRKFRPIGGVSEKRVDSRIILATNLALDEAAIKGTFRSDLLFRLDVIRFRIPPLRERPEDIPMLAEHFIKSNSDLAGSGGTFRISAEAMNILKRYSWPGNVRELRSVIYKTIILSSSSVIHPIDLPCMITSRKTFKKEAGKSLLEAEKNHIIRVLNEVEGNQTKAAEILGINRRTLYNKIRKHRIFD